MLGIMPSHTSQEVMTCIELALRCLEPDRVRRPAISEIVIELNKIDTVESSPIIQLDVGDVEDNYGLEYSDDEPIVSAPCSDTRVQLVIKKYVNKAPLDTNNYKVMLELIGSDSVGDRLGLDLVVVLDVSICMLGKKIHEMKNAMKFIIDKLSPIDRLSIVTFSAAATRLCLLRLVTETSQSELKGLIAGLTAGVDAANISAGLQTGLKVLADRRVSRGRAIAVMIMADGLQINQGNLITIDSNDVPVYTFSLGVDHDPTVLHEVADKSKGGTFSAVILDMHGRCPELDFCFDKLLTVVAQDLRLTVACVGEESTTVIKVITAGSYPQTQDAHHGLVTVSLGNLYSRAVHWVTVDLLLPAVESDHDTYSTCGGLFVAPPSRLTVWRTSSGMGKEKTLALPVEETRLQQMAKKPWTEATRSPSDLSCSYTQRAPARAQGDYDLLVKLLLVSDSSVGKSKLLLQFSDAAFTTNFLTIGIDFKIMTVVLDGKRIKLQIWDTAGQERFRTITTAYYRGAMGILLVYDVADESSFNNIRLWKKNVEEYAPDVNKILVGNRSDMDESKRAVPTSRGQALADEYGIKFFETSAKTNLNVEEAFFSLARDVMQRLSPPEADSIPMDRTIQVETSQRRHRNPLAYALQLLSRKK